MKVWKVVVLVNVALILGVGAGYLWSSLRYAKAGAELEDARSRIAALERQLETSREQEWRVRGVVRAILPDLNVVVLSHEELTGFMPSMTMGFRATSPAIYEGIRVGDAVRFTVRGSPPNVAITAIEKEKG